MVSNIHGPSDQGIGSWQACHEFELNTTKDPPYSGAMYVKSVESSNVLPLVWRDLFCGTQDGLPKVIRYYRKECLNKVNKDFSNVTFPFVYENIVCYKILKVTVFQTFVLCLLYSMWLNQSSISNLIKVFRLNRATVQNPFRNDRFANYRRKISSDRV
ncbi:UNVERIFIED_CONTAM: hypothetical protein NCL1_15471 [Trichonephila clavipes]